MTGAGFAVWMCLFANALVVCLATEVERNQCEQYHNGSDSEEVFLRNIDNVSVYVINGNGLGSVLDDEITDECTEEHGYQSEEDDLHTFQCAAVFLGEEHFYPDGSGLTDQHIAHANQKYEEE